MTPVIRARHLLLWCIKRGVKDEKKKARGKEPPKIPPTAKGDEIVGSIMEDLLQALGNGEIEDSIWAPTKTTVSPPHRRVSMSSDRPLNSAVPRRYQGDSKVSSTATRAHPRNRKNKEIQMSFLADIARYDCPCSRAY